MSKHKLDKLSGLVVVTGASSGIGLELARLAGEDGCDLLLVADRSLADGERAVREAGAATVETLEADLATMDGIEAVVAKIGGRPVAGLFANAGIGEGAKTFLDQEWSTIDHMIQTNVTGTLALIHRVGQQMRMRDTGRILVTGSIVGHMPGAFQLVYSSTKAFINEFCIGLHNELKDTGVVVTCLEPGATDTPFFDVAGVQNTVVGRMPKADPATVAKDGYAAMLAGKSDVVSGFLNKLQAVMGDLLPNDLVAEMHRRMAQPRTPERAD